MLTDTRTYPEPDKTVDDLWFDFRIASLYGNLWDRQEDAIAMKWGRGKSSVPQDVNDLLEQLKASTSHRRPSINDFDPFEDFASSELGKGSRVDYWDTQRKLVTTNRKRARQYGQELEKLKQARQILSRRTHS